MDGNVLTFMEAVVLPIFIVVVLPVMIVLIVQIFKNRNLSHKTEIIGLVAEVQESLRRFLSGLCDGIRGSGKSRKTAETV